MSFDIETAFLSDEEANRLYYRHPQLGKSPDKYCPTCNTTKTYVWKGEVNECNCRRQLQLHKHYLAAGIGVTYQRLDWDDLQDESLKKMLRQYLDINAAHKGMGLFFSGSLGNGKTLSCNLVLKELVKQGFDCFATTFAGMVTMYTSGWKDEDDRRYFNTKVVNSDVLLLDDIGRELRRSNKLSEATFDDVLRTRVQEGRATFLTTNMVESELKSGYGSGVFSLLQEVSLQQEFTGGDYRPTAKLRLAEEMFAGETRPIV